MAKIWLNRVINGGSVRCDFRSTCFMALFLDAFQQFRIDFVDQVHEQRYVETIGGHQIQIPDEDYNLSGKLVNRLIQGSASDVFNTSLELIDQEIQRQEIEARIYFVIFDELWLAVSGQHIAELTLLCDDVVKQVNKNFGLFLPLQARRK